MRLLFTSVECKIFALVMRPRVERAPGPTRGEHILLRFGLLQWQGGTGDVQIRKERDGIIATPPRVGTEKSLLSCVYANLFVFSMRNRR